MKRLELLAPARDTDIGIAAIDCGADAVYIAAPKFGARQAAGNGIEEIADLCSHAHKFGARIFVTLNTILYDNETEEAFNTALAVQEAGADAIIVQDMALVRMAYTGIPVSGTGSGKTERRLHIPLHASTQCAIRTPEKAKFLENAGFSRLILERELSLEQIREIASAVDCETECFVHGALCVCYSGQCYLSEMIAGRSANRGACIQACRSKYDLKDGAGKTIVRNKSLLSLKDYNLKNRLGELAEAGVTSFKIEGRLKNISYVRNVVRAYSEALDEFISRPENRGKFCRASFGKTEGGFIPDTGKTFNRGYTELFIDGKRGRWAAMDAAKSMGEELGTVTDLNSGHTRFTIKPLQKRLAQDYRNQTGKNDRIRTDRNGCIVPVLSNGDGLSFVGRDGEVAGVRADVCSGLTVQCKSTPELYEGARIFRNFDIAFEKKMEANPCSRFIKVQICIVQNCRTGQQDDSGQYSFGCDRHPDNEEHIGNKCRPAVKAVSEDGREVLIKIPDGPAAENRDRMKSMFASQLSKTSGRYSMQIADMPDEIVLPFLPASAINSIRRNIAEQLDMLPCRAVPLYNSEIPQLTVPDGPCTDVSVQGTDGSIPGTVQERKDLQSVSKTIGYKANVSNSLAAGFYSAAGIRVKEKAFELTHRPDAELMRTKYCIRYELRMCPVHHRCKDQGPLFLVNNGRRFRLGFDCRNCEMTVNAL